MIAFLSTTPVTLSLSSPQVATCFRERLLSSRVNKSHSRSHSKLIFQPRQNLELQHSGGTFGGNNNNNNNRTTLVFTKDRDDGDDDARNRFDCNRFVLHSALYLPCLAFSYSNRRTSRRSPPMRFYVSHVILAVNVIIFLIQSVFVPSLLMAGAKINSAIAVGEYYRLFSPMFVHASATHLLVNSFSLNSTGPSVESWFGKRRFLFLYAFSGFCGNLLSYLCTPSPAVGASGAIFGLVGATAVMLARHNRLLGPRARRGLQSLVYIVITNFALGLTPGSRIDNYGHLGGFLGGIAFSTIFGPNLKIRNRSGRAIIYDEPVFKQVQRDIEKRLKQAYRLIKP